MKPRELPETVYVCESQELEPMDVDPSKLDPEEREFYDAFPVDGMAKDPVRWLQSPIRPTVIGEYRLVRTFTIPARKTENERIQ